MSNADHWRGVLKAAPDWEPILLHESNLPGPRANLELMQAAADLGDEAAFRRWIAHDPDAAPVNSPQGFLVMCGVVGLGRLLAEGRTDLLDTVRAFANDPRWRVREAAAMALQRWGAADMPALLAAMESWSRGTLLERRAAVAGLCEPGLLSDPDRVARVLALLDAITASLTESDRRGSDDYKVLRKALGYGWSVAAAACPEIGLPALEKWFASTDRDVIWVMKENLGKNRLARLDAAWVASSKARLCRPLSW